jgi:hypothetical protein
VVCPNCGHLPGYLQVDLGLAHEFAGWGCALTLFIVGNLGRVAFDEEAVWPHTRPVGTATATKLTPSY